MEVLVAISVVGVVSGLTNHFFGQMGRNKQRQRIVATQQRIADSVKNSIKTPSHMYYSITQFQLNRVLAKCLLNILAPSETASFCSRASASNPMVFALFQVTDAMGTKGQQITNAPGYESEPLTGADSASSRRILYDIDGEICASNKPERCMFEAVTEFYVTCADVPNGTPACSRGAREIFVRYAVRQVKNPVAKLTVKLKQIPVVPRYISMSATQILGPHRFSDCGSGAPKLEEFDTSLSDNMRGDRFRAEFSSGYYATLVGYDDSGKPVCKCIYPFVKVGEERDPKTNSLVPVCRMMTDEELACGGDKSYVRGIRYREENKELICVSDEQAFDCSVYDPGPKAKGCPQGTWLNRYLMGDCEFTCDYTSDKNRRCQIQWLVGVPIPSEADKGAFPYFECGEKRLECCKLSHYQ